MGFKEYCNTNNNEDNKFSKTEKMAKEETEKVERLYEQYKDKNEDELLNELFKNVAKQKSEGTFNYNSLIDTINKLSPFLTKEQNLRLNDLLQKIK